MANGKKAQPAGWGDEKPLSQPEMAASAQSIAGAEMVQTQPGTVEDRLAKLEAAQPSDVEDRLKKIESFLGPHGIDAVPEVAEDESKSQE